MRIESPTIAGSPVGHEQVARLFWLAVVAWASVGEVGQAQQYRPAPKFEGKFVPESPQQSKPWTAPATRLPKFLVAATASLFDQGVADPRGCEYRLVEFGQGSVVEGRGFVLPERADAPGRFFVGWDGLVYPALTVGAPADLDRDITDLAASIKRAREGGQANRFNRSVGWSFPGTRQGGYGLAGVDDHSPIKLCLLLRLGRADLAEALFAAATPWTPRERGRDLTDYGISELTLAGDWAVSAFSKLVGAHVKGEDAVALGDARRLARFRDLASARLDALGFPRADRQNRGDDGPGPAARFPFLDQLDDLLRDHERRATMPARGPIPKRGGDPSARVAALIRDLDQIDEQQMSFPGGASPGNSPLVRDLVAEGDPAVAPLLAVLESDDRLTRSVSGGRGRSVGSSIHPVDEAAFDALIRLLKTNEFANQRSYGNKKADPEARKALAASMRQYWEKTRSIPLAERWYRTLLDDSAGSARWLEAAGGITQPEVKEGDPFPKPGTRPMQGEALRAGRDPSVSALMLRRAREVERAGNAPTSYDQGFRTACQLGANLAKWDAKASLPLLQDLCQACRTRSDLWTNDKQHGQYNNSLATTLAEFTQIRVGLGDAGALDEYAGWLRTTSPKMFEYGTYPALKPLLAHPDYPSLASAARWLFNDPKSPWVPLLPQARGVQPPGFQNLFDSPLIAVDGFREGVLAALADKAPLGTVERRDKNSLEMKINNGLGITFGSSKINFDGVATGVAYPFRACDLVAFKMSGLEGSPACELTWPEARRDEAVTACVAYLKRFGDAFTTEVPVGQHDSPEPRAHLKFPGLDHPATPEEVASGRAIFSLAGEGETRLAKIPGFPQMAKWTTLKDTPVDRTYSNDGITRREYDTDGMVWQAEEIFKGERWERYYGFVGHHVIARAPASEVEFSSLHIFWWPLKGGLDGRLEPVAPPKFRFEPSQPVALTLRIRNRLGVARSAPSEFVRVDPDGKPTLRRGVTLSLWYAPTRGDQGRFNSFPFNQHGEVVAPNRDARFVPGEASRSLEPLEAFEAFQINVGDWFDLNKEGQYRLRVAFDPNSGIDEGPAGEVSFQVGGDP